MAVAIWDAATGPMASQELQEAAPKIYVDSELQKESIRDDFKGKGLIPPKL